MGNVEKDVIRGFRTQDVIYCGLFAALMTVGALIKIVLPLGAFEVTVSLQVFLHFSQDFCWVQETDS